MPGLLVWAVSCELGCALPLNNTALWHSCTQADLPPAWPLRTSSDCAFARSPCPSVRHAPGSHAAAVAAAAGDDADSASVAASASASDSQEEPLFLSFEVMDTGVGVSRKALESLFQDYVQVGAGRLPGGWLGPV